MSIAEAVQRFKVAFNRSPEDRLRAEDNFQGLAMASFIKELGFKYEVVHYQKQDQESQDFKQEFFINGDKMPNVVKYLRILDSTTGKVVRAYRIDPLQIERLLGIISGLNEVKLGKGAKAKKSN